MADFKMAKVLFIYFCAAHLPVKRDRDEIPIFPILSEIRNQEFRSGAKNILL